MSCFNRSEKDSEEILRKLYPSLYKVEAKAAPSKSNSYEDKREHLLNTLYPTSAPGYVDEKKG